LPFYAPRSGDLLVLLKRGVMALAAAGAGLCRHAWLAVDYDRRVPILFWRKGMTPFEQPSAVETVDIAATLSAWIALQGPRAYDGRCLDLDAGRAAHAGADR
jgi:hypothetical protein